MTPFGRLPTLVARRIRRTKKSLTTFRKFQAEYKKY